MMGHGAIGVAALLSTAAVGYIVCVKANAEKKGSAMRSVGLLLGAVIIIVGLLGTACIIAKSKHCPMTKKFMYSKDMKMKCGACAGQTGVPHICEKK